MYTPLISDLSIICRVVACFISGIERMGHLRGTLRSKVLIFQVEVKFDRGKVMFSYIVCFGRNRNMRTF